MPWEQQASRLTIRPLPSPSLGLITIWLIMYLFVRCSSGESENEKNGATQSVWSIFCWLCFIAITRISVLQFSVWVGLIGLKLHPGILIYGGNSRCTTFLASFVNANNVFFFFWKPHLQFWKTVQNWMHCCFSRQLWNRCGLYTV